MRQRQLSNDFFDRAVLEVARDLIGCTLVHGEAAGVIVETEAYHESEASCHAHVGRTERAKVLFDGPGTVYVYRSYGIHSLVNLVAEEEGVGAAVLIRALEPTAGIERMIKRRGLEEVEQLCSGPGKLTQALGIELELNRTDITNGPLVIYAPQGGRADEVITDSRIGISKAVDLPWRFCAVGSTHISRPRPAQFSGAA